MKLKIEGEINIQAKDQLNDNSNLKIKFINKNKLNKILKIIYLLKNSYKNTTKFVSDN
jgi:hypothetical protein